MATAENIKIQIPKPIDLYRHETAPYSGTYTLENKAFIWEVLYLLGKDIIVCYRSDLYHDAMYVSKLEPVVQTFYYLIGESGTTIVDKPDSNGLSARYTALACRKYNRPYLFECSIITDTRYAYDRFQFIVSQLADLDTPCIP